MSSMSIFKSGKFCNYKSHLVAMTIFEIRYFSWCQMNFLPLTPVSVQFYTVLG